jgi:glycosyltransferase involved in cell wall biosynthesis
VSSGVPSADTDTHTTPPAHVPALVVSPEAHHGVAVYARQVAAEVARVLGVDTSTTVAALDGPEPPARAHLHFTDRLWADSPEAAAARIEDIARRTRLTVTLHDLPQPSDGERNLGRRRACYARVVAASHGVVVNSRHEAALLAEHTIRSDGAAAAAAASPPVEVIPLPVSPLPLVDPRPTPEPEVAVLGFFYPGKGHAEVIDAVERLHRDRVRTSGGDGGDLGVVVLGRPSPGHEDELEALVTDAARRGVRVTVTGWLDDAAMLERCRSVAVPVAAHRHVSASGSIATWIAAGRRPLVPATRYSEEMAALRPGTLTLLPAHDIAPGTGDESTVDTAHDTADLAAAIATAVDTPATTWIADDAVTRPDLHDTALAHLRWFAALDGRIAP